MDFALFFGLTTVDICNYVGRYPESNGKVRAVEQLVYAGGPAANAAVSCCAMGVPTTLMTSLGRHPLAHLAKEDLRERGVELVDCQVDRDELPVLSSITIDLTSGDRSVVYTNTQGRRITAEFDIPAMLHGCTLVMFDGYYIEQAVLISEAARKLGIPIVLDGGSWKEGLETLLPYIDYAVCSADFFPPGCSNLDEVIPFLHGYGIAHVAVSRGPEPLLFSYGGRTGEITVPSCEVVDTLGAGDILHGVFCASLLTDTFVESLRRASEVASQSCRYRGTRAWIMQDIPNG